MAADWMVSPEWRGRFVAEASLRHLERHGLKDTEAASAIRGLLAQWGRMEAAFEKWRPLIEAVERDRDNGATTQKHDLDALIPR